MVAGDFNSVVNQGETSNYRAFSVQRSSEFVDWIQSEGIVDMGFNGPKFTWNKGNSTRQAKGTRLDRALCNISWRHRFPEATVTHLPRVSSDHAPILIRLMGDGSKRSRSAFKFQADWLTSEHLSEIVRHTWRADQAIQENIPRMTETLDKWNMEVFGNVFHRKKFVLARLGGGVESPFSNVSQRACKTREETSGGISRDIVSRRTFVVPSIKRVVDCVWGLQHNLLPCRLYYTEESKHS